jgi:hypothetical protein
MESQLTALLDPIVSRLWKLQDEAAPRARRLGTTAQPMTWQSPAAESIRLPKWAFAHGDHLLH